MTPKCSIVVPTYNLLKYSKKCIGSILKNTRDIDYELIVVDNGSTDGTPEHLKSIPQVKLIANEKNLGYTKANNQGILAARGDYIILLNNDLVVPRGWLSAMVRCAQSDPKVGLVGVRENWGIGRQFSNPLFYYPLKFIKDLLKIKGRDSWIETDKIFGFCLLLKRELIVKVGLLDEFSFYGEYTDDDLSFRARQAGYKLLIAGQVVLYHFHSKTFKGRDFKQRKIKRTAHSKIYGDYFAKKWQEMV